jgi:hypothetical protein
LLKLLNKKNLKVSVPSKRTMIGNRKMTTQEYSQYVKHSGDMIMQLLKEYKPELEQYDSEEGQKLIDYIVREVRQEAKDKVIQGEKK